MSSTAIEYWNEAMLQIGADRITAAGTDSEAQLEAELAATIYATEKRSLLRMYAWNCATKRAELAQLAEQPISQYNYAFALPDDNLRVLEVRSGDYRLSKRAEGERAYVIEGRTVLTNETNINVRYVADIDEVYFDPHLAETLVAKLAFKSVFAIGQSANARKTFGQVYDGILNEARTTDALENPNVVLKTDSLINVRY